MSDSWPNMNSVQTTKYHPSPLLANVSDCCSFTQYGFSCGLLLSAKMY